MVKLALKKTREKHEPEKPPAVVVVKRRGRFEPFDGKKLFASVYHACRDARMDEESAETISAKVLARVEAAIAGKGQVESIELFRIATRELLTINGEAGFQYEHHLDVA